MSNEIKLINFDIGGVLIRIATDWEDSFIRAGLDVSQIPIDDEVVKAITTVYDQYEINAMDDATYASRIKAIVPHFSIEEIWRAFDAWLIECYTGVGELIDAIHSLGLTTSCMSNTNARHWNTFMLNPGIFEAVQKLQHPHASHLLEAAKPGNEIYQRFEQAMGVTGDQIVYFDDRADNTATALEMGWRAFRIDPTQQTVPQIRGHLASLGIVLDTPIH